MFLVAVVISSLSKLFTRRNLHSLLIRMIINNRKGIGNQRENNYERVDALHL